MFVLCVTLLIVRGTMCVRARANRGVWVGGCVADGVPKKTNQALIKKAKVVGSDLGFLS